MLFDLYIENFVLIESISIKFTKGLNIITGETGAGKSIIFKAIDLILGGKSSKDIIKVGRETSVLQGSFDISDNQITKETLTESGISFDDNVICISRELSRNGRSISRINGRVVATSLIKEISASMVEITGQHEHQHLLKQQNHIHLLDSFGSNDILSEQQKVKTLFHDIQSVKRELEKIDYSQEEI
ncbi:MAG: AAA family ATPase, partial [Acidaminobacteraceae bacterium]